jgi:hypothetical protein
MKPDADYLRQHYALLSDEALLEIDRDDLVDLAQQLYDHELARRNLNEIEEAAEEGDEPARAEEKARFEPSGSDEPPEWLDEAAEVFSSTFRPGASTAADEVYTAREVIERGGIPCYLDTVPEEGGTSRCRVLVPGKFNMRAASLLDKEIFNADFESEWRTHLEALSDDELAEMNPREAFCGLFDRVERVTRAYNREIARRQRS